ncbi:Equilibrative nucleotide transporter 3 [Nymphaea thermarum]|nr:Equilibrative nucleotide transporter 3 [Nymphaea thermarum]
MVASSYRKLERIKKDGGGVVRHLTGGRKESTGAEDMHSINSRIFCDNRFVLAAVKQILSMDRKLDTESDASAQKCPQIASGLSSQTLSQDLRMHGFTYPYARKNGTVGTLQGKYAALVMCWILGNGSLLSWNSMLTIEDYYGYLFPRYHPSRVLTLVYQPFALGTIALLTYYEARLNTRRRNLGGYTLFFISSFLVIVLDLARSGRGGINAYVGICAISGAFGIADAHVQGGMLGDLSLMRPEFIQVTTDLAAAGVLQDTQTDLENPKDFQRFSNKQLLIQNIDYAIDLYLIYVLTLSIFPGFLYEDTGSHSLGFLYGLVLVASYNVSDLIERYTPLIKTVKITSSNEFFVLQEPEQNTLGNFLCCCLLAGIFSGVTLDWLWLIGKGW